MVFQWFKTQRRWPCSYFQRWNQRLVPKWKKNKQWHSFKVIAALETSEIIENTETEFITEHYWGYAKVSSLRTNEYEVTHPKWSHYKIESTEINVDFGAVYGVGFEFLSSVQPNSVILAEGSKITVERKRYWNWNLTKA